MNRPSFLSGILAAFCIAALAFLSYPLISGFFPYRIEGQMMIALVALAYGGYLLFASGPTAGKLVLGAVGCAVSFVSIAGTMGVMTALLLQGLWIWSVRWLCYQRTFVGAMFDGGLLVLGLAAAGIVASYTHGIFLTIWSALLLQSLFVFIPTVYGAKRQSAAAASDENRFDRSRRAAEAALKQIAVR